MRLFKNAEEDRRDCLCLPLCQAICTVIRLDSFRLEEYPSLILRPSDALNHEEHLIGDKIAKFFADLEL